MSKTPGVIFREYIGVKPNPGLNDFPGEMINNDIPAFHFILGFAIEDYDENGKGTGYFNYAWNHECFSPNKVKGMKEQHKNVKVVISIGGVGAEYPFNPADKEKWHLNAIDSIKGIIMKYIKECGPGNVIDGIDINYENIKSNPTEFADSIGQVINELKKDGLIEVVSIAPSEHVSSHYLTLYNAHKDDINWVNYQFYNQTDLGNKDQFVRLFHKLSNDYHGKLLAGFSTDTTQQGMPQDVFFQGCTDLVNTKSLPGIFIWNANDSAARISNDGPFRLEHSAQSLLLTE